MIMTPSLKKLDDYVTTWKKEWEEFKAYWEAQDEEVGEDYEHTLFVY